MGCIERAGIQILIGQHLGPTSGPSYVWNLSHFGIELWDALFNAVWMSPIINFEGSNHFDQSTLCLSDVRIMSDTKSTLLMAEIVYSAVKLQHQPNRQTPISHKTPLNPTVGARIVSFEFPATIVAIVRTHFVFPHCTNDSRFKVKDIGYLWIS